jgi:beta-lactamase class A
MTRAFLPRCVFSILIAAVCAAAQQPAAPPSKADLLRRNIERVIQSVSADWGVYVKSPATGEEVAINADTPMDTMSVIKVPLLVTAFRDIDAGKLDPKQRLDMQTADKRFGTGVLRTLDDGLNLTLEDALTLMIIQSDNTATDLVFQRVGGPQRVTETMRELGLNSITATGTAFDWFRALGEVTDPSYAKLTPAELFTKGYPQSPTRQADVERFHFEGKHPFGLSSARDMGRLIEMIATNKAASPDSCRKMMRLLAAQQMNTRIPKYLAQPSGHKTGDFPPYIANDAGYIMVAGQPVVVVFFNAHHRGVYTVLEDAVARAAEQVANYFSYRAP